MPFPESHIYWSFHWNVTPAPRESGQFGLRSTTPGTPPTLTTVQNVLTALNTFWSSINGAVAQEFKLFRAKAALIRPDGTYDPGFDPVVVDQTPVSGNGTGTARLVPLQVAHSLRLGTDRSSGPAHAGRVFLPPMVAALSSTTFRYSVTDVNNRAAAFATFLTAANTALGSDSIQIYSSKGIGAKRTVTFVQGDDRPDVQRRRARQQDVTWGTENGVT